MDFETFSVLEEYLEAWVENIFLQTNGEIVLVSDTTITVLGATTRKIDVITDGIIESSCAGLFGTFHVVVNQTSIKSNRWMGTVSLGKEFFTETQSVNSLYRF